MKAQLQCKLGVAGFFEKIFDWAV